MSANNTFFARVISGLVLGPLTLAAIFLGGLFFQAFIAIAFGLAVKEWVRMARISNHAWRDGIIGVLYIAFCMAAFMKLRLDLEQGPYLTITLLIGVWSSDIIAYFSGKFIGGLKLAPKISPNKTWAGFIGGMVGSALALTAMDYFAPVLGAIVCAEFVSFAPLGVAFVFGAFFTIFGQIGDLMISSYKRKVGVKDTGHLIPGHGGILDRIDSLLLVTPFFLIVLQVLGNA